VFELLEIMTAGGASDCKMKVWSQV